MQTVLLVSALLHAREAFLGEAFFLVHSRRGAPHRRMKTAKDLHARSPFSYFVRLEW